MAVNTTCKYYLQLDFIEQWVPRLEEWSEQYNIEFHIVRLPSRGDICMEIYFNNIIGLIGFFRDEIMDTGPIDLVKENPDFEGE